MVEKRNVLAVLFAFIAGVLLIISGEQGPTGTYTLILEKLSMFIEDPLLLNIARVVGLILTILSSLGGFAVLIGGYLIFKKKMFFGKLLIALGAGFGIVSLLFLVATLIRTQEIAVVIARHTIFGWAGITLSLLARAIAK